MRKVVDRTLAGGVLLAGLLAAQSASALSSGAVGLFSGSTLSANGLTFVVNDCIVRYAGAAPTACPSGGGATFEMLQSPGAGSTIKIQGLDGADIFHNISFAATGFYDLNFTLNVSAPLPTTRVTSVGMTMSSTLTNNGGGTAVTALSAGESSTAAGFTNFTLNGYGLTSGSSTTSTIFPATTTFSVNKDLKITPNGSSGIKGADMVSLHYVTQTFLPAPEPMSIALMLSALGGLVYARRRMAPRR